MTDDNTKDWASIRIEEPVRDDASDADPTYTAIMRAGLLAIESGLVTTHPDGTVTETKRADDVPGPKAYVEPDVSIPPEALVEALERATLSPSDGLSDQLDRIESAAEAAEERTGSIQNALENEGIGR